MDGGDGGNQQRLATRATAARGSVPANIMMSKSNEAPEDSHM